MDVLTTLDVDALITFHRKSGKLATLAVKERTTFRYLHFDEQLNLCAWSNEKTGERKNSRRPTGKTTRLAFSGIHVVDPAVLDAVKLTGTFSITDMYLELAKDHQIGAFVHIDDWLDVGKPESLAVASEFLRKHRLMDHC